MDYEQRYKEALEVAKRKLCFDKAGMVDSFTPNDIYEMFPELKESEDEKVRKTLIKFFEKWNETKSLCYGVSVNKILAWLDKQGLNHLDGEVDQPRYNIGDIICDKSCTTLNKEAQPNMEIVDIKNGMYICDKGSFPVSQQDEYELVGKRIDTKLNDDSVSNELRDASFAHAEREMKNQTFPDNLEFELIYTFEEGAKWDAAQRSTLSEDGWTMQDEEELQIALDTLIKAGQHSSAKWLKNVCLVPQNKWKPSGVQMTVLDEVITNGHLSNVNEKILKGLQEQLRKLK